MWPNQGTTEAFRDIVYVHSLYRTDEDQAIFGSVSFDITDDLETTVGARYFEPEVTVEVLKLALDSMAFGLGLEKRSVVAGRLERQAL